MKKLLALILLFAFNGAVGAFEPIVDDFVNATLKGVEKNADFSPKPLPKNIKKDPAIDEVIETLNNDKVFPSAPKKASIIVTNVQTAAANNEIPVFISSPEAITTRKAAWEGKEVEFVVAKDIAKDGKVVLQKGTKVAGRIELVTKNGPFGTPAELTLSNFVLPDGKKLKGEIRVSGATRSYWVYPIGYLTLPFFFAGAAVFTIRGGHAKIKPGREFELIY